jgi:signal transduction histidine kinase
MSWISQQQGQSDVIREKLNRAVDLIREAINIKRKLVEALRPSLLDEMGLFDDPLASENELRRSGR